ncbi:DUF4270 family protein [Algoriphagus sp. C2-7]|uniref:DUF4270 family protein n=2 Tax=Algoriphagus sediminis TaxID=3057113 RepID=A0ABT7YCK1_9BACT|nr:DUF4270 family protein [Algoriphagus sediminis]
MSYLKNITSSPVKWAIGLSISFLLLISCSDPSTVGLQLAPENNQIGVFFEEFELEGEVVLLDSFNTTNQSVLVVGNEVDPYFGRTEGTGYTRLFIDAFDERPRGDASLDSIFFTLDVVSVNGTDLDEPKSFSVYRLEEPILDTLYYNFSSLTFSEDPIAFEEVVFEDVKDTTMRLSVDKDFANDLFDKLRRGEEFEDLFSFREYLPGIAIQIGEDDNTTAGINLGFETGFEIFYSYLNDTVSSEYSISTASSRSFNGVVNDPTGTPTAVVQEPGVAYKTGNKLGMKSNLGMVIKVDTSPIDEFLDTLPGVSFQQANFELGEIDEFPEGQNPLANMVVYFTDETNTILTRTLDGQPLSVQQDGQPQVVVDEDGNLEPATSAPAVFTYFDSDDRYRVQITSHVNAIYREQLLRKDWLLYGNSPDTGGDDFKRSFRQFVLDNDKIRLRIIYSKAN